MVTPGNKWSHLAEVGPTLVQQLITPCRKYYYTTYEVKVQVFNDMCEEPGCKGPVSDPVEIYSAEDMPQVAPTKVGARPFNSTAINITWNQIPDVREKVSIVLATPGHIWPYLAVAGHTW